MGKTTLLDIAKAVEVSKTTVSMVLNRKPINVSEETKKRIFEAAEELNYIPNSLARSLTTNKSNTIGFIIPDIQNPFFAEMTKAIEIAAENNGYNMILCNTFNSGKKEEEHIKLLISKLIDGVIIVPSGEKNQGIEILKGNNVPFVIADRMISDHEGINGVFSDNESGIKVGVEYLLEKGHKSIAFISGKQEGIVNTRLHYFKKIVAQYGIFKEELIESADFSIEGGISATEKLMDKGRTIDSIFYSSDVMAIGGMKYLLRKGYRIPEDISILGYDNIAMSSFIEPELTTVAQPIYKMGEESFNLLMKLLKSKTSEGKVKLMPYLVERKTV
ncbi:MAG: LacI family DNA-binding transcriptional regulator [Clostridium sp.]